MNTNIKDAVSGMSRLLSDFSNDVTNLDCISPSLIAHILVNHLASNPLRSLVRIPIGSIEECMYSYNESIAADFGELDPTENPFEVCDVLPAMGSIWNVIERFVSGFTSEELDPNTLHALSRIVLTDDEVAPRVARFLALSEFKAQMYRHISDIKRINGQSN